MTVPGDEDLPAASPLDAVAELRRLNENLERLAASRSTFEALEEQLRTLNGRLVDLGKGFRSLPSVRKELHILNQILLQVKRGSGNAGMIQTLLTGILEFARRGR